MASRLVRATIEQLRAGLRVLEEHLVEIAQPEQQQGVLGQFAFDAAILRHHGSELGFGRHAAKTVPVNQREMKAK